MFLKIALLNIVKHAKRSVVVFVAVAIAVLVMTLIGSVILSIGATFLESIIPTAGHIQIKAEGSKQAANPLDLKFLLPNADELLAKIDNPLIVRKEKILNFPALLVQPVPTDSKKEAKNIGIMGQGVDPQTGFFRNIRQGVIEGSFLPEGEGILISKRVAQLLDLKLGGTVMVLTQDRNNNPWYQELKITGLFVSGSDQTDQSLFVVSHKTAETLLDAEGMTREIRVMVKDSEKSSEVRNALDPVLKESHLKGETWQEIFGSFLTILKFIDIISYVIRAFFVIVAGSVITNSILMAVFERIREYGTLRAIGLKRKQLFGMILSEGFLLGVFGALAGLILGIPFVAFLSQVGLDLGSLNQYLGLQNRIYPILSPADWLFDLCAGIVIALAASFYAARVSSKLSVTESLTHI